MTTKTPQQEKEEELATKADALVELQAMIKGREADLQNELVEIHKMRLRGDVDPQELNALTVIVGGLQQEIQKDKSSEVKLKHDLKVMFNLAKTVLGVSSEVMADEAYTKMLREAEGRLRDQLCVHESRVPWLAKWFTMHHMEIHDVSESLAFGLRDVDLPVGPLTRVLSTPSLKELLVAELVSVVKKHVQAQAVAEEAVEEVAGDATITAQSLYGWSQCRSSFLKSRRDQEFRHLNSWGGPVLLS